MLFIYRNIAYFVLWLSFLACTGVQTSVENNAIITLTAPDSLVVDQKKVIELQMKNIAAGEKIYLIMQDTWGVKTTELLVENPSILKTAIADTVSGLLTVRVAYKNKILAEKSITIIPDNAVKPLDSYLGSKSIVANGEDWAMITAIPTDKFGNLTKDSTNVKFDILTPTNEQEVRTSTSNFGVAFQKIVGKTVTGKTFIVASTGEVKGKQKELLQVADFPIDFTIVPDKNSLYADARQIFKVKSSILKDKNNNIVSEGTLVLFQIKDSNGTLRQMNGYTLNGVAEIYLQNPNTSGNIEVEASVFGGGKSNLITINFQNSQDIAPTQSKPVKNVDAPLNLDNNKTLKPDNKIAFKSDNWIALKNITFKSRSAELINLGDLKDVIKSLKNDKNSIVQIASFKSNEDKRLGEDQRYAIREILITNGISDSRITILRESIGINSESKIAVKYIRK